MKRPQLILFIALSLLIASCGRGTGSSGIFANRAAAPPLTPSGPAQDATIVELLEAPAAREGDLLRVTGQYRRAPFIVCDDLVRRSPATWMLADESQTISARGFESLVHPLLPRGLTMTVEGVWRHWRGPVGCGKDAPRQDVWYLQVTNIVSPSPVARVTLTPTTDGLAQAPTATPQPTGDGEPGPVGTPVPEPSPTPEEATGTPPPTATPRTPTPGAPTFTPTAETEEPDATPTATSAADETATAEGTEAPTTTASPTATSAAGGATASPTATRTVADMGSVDFQDLRGDFMSGTEIHSWQFSVRAGDAITINVASRLETDVRLAVLDPAGNRIVDQNSSGAGEIERIEGLEAGAAGAYRLLINEEQGRDTDYMLILLNDGLDNYFAFSFAGVLSYGSNRSGSLAEEMDHFWFFFGNAGERITINVAPTDNSNLFLEVYDPEGNMEVETIDDATAGGTEQLLNFQLPTTGLFAIRVGEMNYEPANYTVLVARN
ncbi:MAG TPA: hypothetical protein VK879_16535 [Candidatus Sulfomarinibacteraceae bacterium]|nr:hypothetical protein [Candidatus Sulfomarinibacteraceae bacterium]